MGTPLAVFNEMKLELNFLRNFKPTKEQIEIIVTNYG